MYICIYKFNGRIKNNLRDMKKSNKKMNKKIPIHWLHSQVYCEHQIYLEYVKGVEVEPTPEMQKGKEIHAILEDQHRKKAQLELTIAEALQKAKHEKKSLIGREVPVIGNHLYGLIDEIHFTPYHIVIIDDKPNYRPLFSNKKQVWGYCLAFQEQFKPDLPIIASLRHRDSQKIIWQEKFLEEHKKMVLESVERILDILNGNRKPQPTSKLNKCRNCKLNSVCDVYKMRFEDE